MQNYQNFIDELFQLNIDTVQYFVKDGQVVYDHLPEYYPADAPADRLPGHVSTFMSLDRYDDHRTENRYADMLVELQRRAITDVLLLEPAQTTRLISDAKTKCERLTQLLKNAIEYQMAWGYDTLDRLSACFLELQLLDAFTIKSRPEASPHDRFAHHLTDAIMYKRGILSGFIRQIETTLQPAPAVLPDATQEPEYDLWYVENDGAYAFAKLKELARYLPTVEPFTKRVELFFEISRVWDIKPGWMGMGTTNRKPEPEDYSRNTEDRKPVDKNGQRVEEVAWGVSYSNDEEKRVLRKLYFLRFYRPRVNKLSHRPCYKLDQLISQYSTQIQTERGKRLIWEWVTTEIEDRQQLINDRFATDRNEYKTPETRKQFQDAAVLIELELEGTPAIRWESFHGAHQLDPLCLLWGLVEYKRFLETEEQPAPPPYQPLLATKTRNQCGPKRQNTVEKNEENLTYFRQEVRNGIEKALRANSEPDEKAILKNAMLATATRKKVGSEKLRKDIPPAMREEFYGKIYREESEHKKLFISRST